MQANERIATLNAWRFAEVAERHDAFFLPDARYRPSLRETLSAVLVDYQAYCLLHGFRPVAESVLLGEEQSK